MPRTACGALPVGVHSYLGSVVEPRVRNCFMGITNFHNALPGHPKYFLCPARMYLNLDTDWRYRLAPAGDKTVEGQKVMGKGQSKGEAPPGAPKRGSRVRQADRPVLRVSRFVTYC